MLLTRSYTVRSSHLVGMWAIIASGLTMPASISSDHGDIDFDRDIRPVLAENCLACHGPDENDRQAGLRLDTREGATAWLPSDGRAIVPGDSQASTLVERISSHNPDKHMPPPEAGEPLSEQQVQIITRWIEQGAGWQEHWSFRPLQVSPLPKVSRSASVQNPIDAFVLQRLESKGIQVSPAADRYTLIKRLHYDLIGLPPFPADVTTFVEDRSADAYERLVDRLLASPHFGERWGGTGWTKPGMPTRTATRQIGQERFGRIAIGLLTPSTKTCRLIGSPSNRSPATCCQIRRPISCWLPPSIETR